MPERIVTFLRGLRRRLLLVRAAEAAAVGGVVGGLTAVVLMGARILAGRYPQAAAAMAVGLLAGGALLAAFGGARRRLGLAGPAGWVLVALPAACGLAGLAALLTGAFAGTPKNALAWLAPLAAAAAAGLQLAQGPTLTSVAAWADRHGRLRERLSTSWELLSRNDRPGFAQAVHQQAEAAAEAMDLRRIRFWTRTRATLGALGLSLAAVALMLPWNVLESPEAVRQRDWAALAPQAGRTIQEQLAALERGGSDPALAAQVARLAELAEEFRTARADLAGQWQAKAVELERLTEALRRASASGQLDEPTRQQVARLVRALEQVAARLAEGMGRGSSGGSGAGETVAEAPAAPASPTRQSNGNAWATVYNRRYENLSTAPGGEGSPTTAAGVVPVPQVPIEQAWQQALRRAAESMDRGDVPAEYRQLVRDFFAEDAGR